MSKLMNNLALMLCLILISQITVGGIVDPDCTAKKAVRSSAMKSTVGIGGRCSPAEAAKDTATGMRWAWKQRG